MVSISTYLYRTDSFKSLGLKKIEAKDGECNELLYTKLFNFGILNEKNVISVLLNQTARLGVLRTT